MTTTNSSTKTTNERLKEIDFTMHRALYYLDQDCLAIEASAMLDELLSEIRRLQKEVER